MRAVRRTADASIADLSGKWDDPLFPFVQGYQIPRKVIESVFRLLQNGKRLILLEGPPLIGKSNALRELSVKTKDTDELVTFFIEAGSGAGVFQNIADTLSQALDWPITKHEARVWLQRISKGDGPALVLAIDDIGSSHDDFRRDVEDLTSQAFGPGVRLVLAIDDTVAGRIVLDSTGRKASVIGRKACRVSLGQLDDQEFELACNVLQEHRVGIMNGGQLSPEFRLPWVLRVVVSHIVSQPQHPIFSFFSSAAIGSMRTCVTALML